MPAPTSTTMCCLKHYAYTQKYLFCIVLYLSVLLNCASNNWPATNFYVNWQRKKAVLHFLLDNVINFWLIKGKTSSCKVYPENVVCMFVEPSYRCDLLNQTKTEKAESRKFESQTASRVVMFGFFEFFLPR